jgi:hypothetical protein
MDREDDGQRGLRDAAQIDRRQAGLPVVTMHDVRIPAVRSLFNEARRSHGQGGEAQVIVAPVAAVRPEIRVPGPVVEMRRIEGENIEPVLRDGREDTGRPAEQVVVDGDDLCVAQGLRHGGIERQHDSDAASRGGKAQGQGADDVGKAARLDEWIAFGGDHQDVH